MLSRELIVIDGAPVQIVWTGDYHGTEVRVCVVRDLDEQYRFLSRWRWSVTWFTERSLTGESVRNSEATESAATQRAFDTLWCRLQIDAAFAVDNSDSPALRLTD
jgi:hypothetical protein